MRRLIFVGSVVVGLLAGSVFGGTYSGGSGTAEEPYLISEPNDLIELDGSNDDQDKSFLMTADMDLADMPGVSIGFSGVFDGGGHTISNLEIIQPARDYVGMFGYHTGTVKNLRLVDVNIEGDRFVGGLVGKIEKGGEVVNCYVSGTVVGHGNEVGGLVGSMYRGNVSNCHGDVTVSGRDSVGGVLGHCREGSVEQCSARGSVSGRDYVGGLGGHLSDNNYASIAIQCFAEGTVIGTGDLVGGLLGSGRVRECYSTATVSGEEYVGGLVGGSSMLLHCYSVGPVSGNGERVGGLAGSANATNSYWDVESSGIAEGGGGMGLSTVRMKQMLTYSLSVWDGEVWTIDDGNDYPRLAWENAGGVPIGDSTVPLTGSGTVEAPYEIWTVDDYSLLTFGEFLWDKHFILMNDLDFQTAAYPELGLRPIPSFSGTFDGNAHVIRNLAFDECEGNSAGMFAELEGGTIRRLGLEDVNIDCGRYAGGLVSLSDDGTITECYVTGSVRAYYESKYADGRVGGLVATNGGTITDCWTDVSVGGVSGHIAGLAGRSSGTIRRCYAVGAVGGTSKYHAGLVSGYETADVFDSFFDIDTTGLAEDRGGGLGLKTSLMKDMRTYGWNGWEGSVWRLDDGADYPHLAWENKGGIAIDIPPVTLAGSGTEGDPYQIATVADYEMITLGRYFWDKHYVLVNDLDLAGMEMQRIGYDVHHVFSGTFDGGRHVIRNLRMEIPESSLVGMFGIMTGLVKDLGLEGVIVTGDDDVGGLAGVASGPIRRSYVTGEVAGDMRVGGMAGSIGGTIAKCYSRCSVMGSIYVGGLAGTSGDEVKYCYSIGSVSGRERVGGLIGQASGSDEVVQCFAASSVIAEEEYVGGLTGSGGAGPYCFWDNDVAGVANNFQGRGLSTASMMQKETYIFNFWDELVWTIDDGNDYPHLAWENAYGESLGFEVPMGGAGTEQNPYEIRTVEEFAVIGLGRYFCDKHFVLVNDLDLLGITVYPIGEDSYEYSFRGSFEGGGHVIRNLRIDTAERAERDLVGMFGYVEYGVSVRNLGLEDVFVRGRYDVGGLAGYSAGTIENCYVTGEVEGYLQVGGLVGINYAGEISRCYARGTVTGFTETGGLVGWNYSAYFDERIGVVSECYAACEVNGTDDYLGLTWHDQYVGGLVGSSSGQLENCYSMSSVNVDSDHRYLYAGGLAGTAGYVDKCYSYGPVSIGEGGYGAIAGGLLGYGNSQLVTGSYWDVEASGVEVSSVGTGLSTEEMQQQATYIWSGWDLAGEKGNGVYDIWRMCDGMDYPRLWWEGIAGDFATPCGVGMEDFALLASAWLSEGGDVNWDAECNLDDFNGDVIDMSDLAVFSSNWQVYGCLRDNLDLVGYWTFDEGEGETAHDSSVYERDGVLSRMPYWREGYIGNALSFNGQNAYVEITGYKGIGGGQSRTVSAWIFAGHRGGEIMSWGSDGIAGGKWVFCTDEQGHIQVEVGDGFISGSTDVCDVQWHHVAAVLISNGSSDVSEVILYVDGAVESIGSYVGGAIDTVIDSEDSFDVKIGAWKPLENYFGGIIDEVRIYNRGLSEGEIWQLAAEELEPATHWGFNETTGNLASDAAPHALHGTLINMDDSDWVEGKVGNALEFDGVDDFVEITGFSGLLGGQSRTVCAWIKVDSVDDVSRAIVSWGSENTGGRWLFMLDNSGRGHPGSLRVAAQGGTIAGVRDLRDGQWHHVAAVLEDDGSANVSEVLLYIDGLPEEINVSVPVAINTGDASGGIAMNDVRVGAFYLAGSEMYFEGLIDEVRLYDRPLSNEEIGVLANP